MQDALTAPRLEYLTRDKCKISYYADNVCIGQPLLLIHSINAAPSAHEVKPLFDHYRKLRPVFALDLPGFGHSDRSKQVYSPNLYAAIINEFLAHVINQRCDVICFSLSAEFTAMAANQNNDYIHSIVMISPTGFSVKKPPSGPITEYIRLLFSASLIGDFIFNILTSKKSIRYFLNKSFVGNVPDEMVDCAYMVAHQSGAKHAPFYFLSGQLFTPDVYKKFYIQLTMPVLVIFDKDPYMTFELLFDLVKQNKHWSAKRIEPTLGMPHWEMLDETCSALDEFWSL